MREYSTPGDPFHESVKRPSPMDLRNVHEQSGCLRSKKEHSSVLPHDRRNVPLSPLLFQDNAKDERFHGSSLLFLYWGCSGTVDDRCGSRCGSYLLPSMTVRRDIGKEQTPFTRMYNMNHQATGDTRNCDQAPVTSYWNGAR